MSNCNIKQEDLIYDLKEGLKAEERARDLCHELAFLLEDQEDKAKVEKIAEDEERHIKIVRKLIDVVENFYQE